MMFRREWNSWQRVKPSLLSILVSQPSSTFSSILQTHNTEYFHSKPPVPDSLTVSLSFFAWLDWQPRVPLPLWLLLLVAFVICWVLYAFRSRELLPQSRRRWMLSLMLVAGMVPLILLLNPTWVEPLPPPEGRPLVTVLVDASASMDIADQPGSSQTRFVRSQNLAQQVLGDFDETYETRVVSFDQTTQTVDDASNWSPSEFGEGTDLSNSISDSSQRNRPRGQAIILISDGNHNAGPSRRAIAAAKAARSRGAAVFPIAMGEDINLKNLSLETFAASRLGFVKQPVAFSVKVSSQGFDPAPITVEFSRDGKVIETKSITIDRNETSDVLFLAESDEPGLLRYNVRVSGLPDEATLEDNSLNLLVRVIDEPIRVLLLEGKPYWDSKFLARNLASDPSIELDTLVMLRPERFLHRVHPATKKSASEDTADEDADPDTPAWQILPTPQTILGSAGALEKYQVIVLGRDAEAFLDDTTLQRLRTWIARKGGSLVCSRGQPESTLSQRLARMLPIRWSPSNERRLRAQASKESAEEGWLLTDPENDPLSAMPSLASASNPETRGGLPRVLASSRSDGSDGKEIPIATYQPFGAGRTVVVEGTGMWRWALLSPEFAAADKVYPSVWNGLLQWLVSRVALTPGQDRVLQSERIRFDTDESAVATLLIRESISTQGLPQVELSSDSGEFKKTVQCEPIGDQPGVYQVRFGKLPPGSYRATLMDAGEKDRSVTAFDVRRPIDERLDVRPQRDLLEQIAKESGGKMLDPNEPAVIADAIEEHISDSLPIETTRTPAWDKWWTLMGVLALWTTLWTFRRNGGLV